jgi:hypothetical protein
MLDTIKQQLKTLIGQCDHAEFFARMGEILRHEAEVYNDMVMIQSAMNNSGRIGNLDLISDADKRLRFNNENHALLSIVERIRLEDLGELYRRKVSTHAALPPFHAYTCDRVEQNEAFQLAWYTSPPEKIRFFYMSGDADQRHHSLFQRLGYEIGGHLLNWEQGHYDPGVQLRFFALKPQACANPMLYHINVVRELLAKFIPQVNTLQPIQQRKLSEVLDSNHLQGLGANDLVFILLTIDDYNWNEHATPAVVKSLVEGFCNCDLPEAAPHFFFFFGIEYRKENQTVRQQVQQAIQNRVKGEYLPELSPVPADFLAEWFSRYRVVIPSGKTARETARMVFGDSPVMDMLDIETRLQQIIEDHNKGLVIRDK